jgi:hypothetical protein
MLAAIGVFLFFGAVMAALAGTTLIWHVTLLDNMWVLNASAYRQLAPFGKTVGVPFLVLSAVLAAAGAGWFGRHLWDGDSQWPSSPSSAWEIWSAFSWVISSGARRVSRSLAGCSFMFCDQR